MKKIFEVVFLIFLSQCVIAQSDDEKTADAEAGHDSEEVILFSDPDMKLASVNGKAVYFRDISEQYAKNIRVIREKGAQLSSSIHDFLLQGLIAQRMDEILMLEEADRLGIKSDPEKVEEILSKFRDRFESDEEYKAYFRNIGITVEQARQKVEDRFRISAFQEQLFRDINVTEEDAALFYRENEAMFNPGEEFLIGQIMLYYPKNATDVEKTFLAEKMQGIRQKLVNGADFEETAKTESEGVTASKGGVIGWVDERKMDSGIMEELKKIKPGDITPVLVTSGGVHILKLMDFKPSGPTKDFENIKNGIIESMILNQKRDKLSSCLDNLKKEAEIELLYPPKE